jgi:hypothetical protein
MSTPAVPGTRSVNRRFFSSNMALGEVPARGLHRVDAANGPAGSEGFFFELHADLFGDARGGRVLGKLDPGNLDEILGELVERLQSDYSKDRLKTPLDRFQASTVFTCGYLDAIKGSMRLRKAYADENEV